jgi:hypothetical protein
MFWKRIFGEPTINLEKAKKNNKSKVIGASSFTNSNGNTYYVTRLKRDTPIPVIEKSSLAKKISSFLKN